MHATLGIVGYLRPVCKRKKSGEILKKRGSEEAGLGRGSGSAGLTCAAAAAAASADRRVRLSAARMPVEGGAALLCSAWAFVHVGNNHRTFDFRQLVLGCIKSDFNDYNGILNSCSKSTQMPGSIFKTQRILKIHT